MKCFALIAVAKRSVTMQVPCIRLRGNRAKNARVIAKPVVVVIKSVIPSVCLFVSFFFVLVAFEDRQNKKNIEVQQYGKYKLMKDKKRAALTIFSQGWRFIIFLS